MSTCSQIQQVCSTRGGLAGRLIRRVALRRASQAQAQANYDGSLAAKEQVEQQGSAYLSQAVADLNEAIRFEATLRAAFAGGQETHVSVSKTATYLQAIATTSTESVAKPPSPSMLGNAPIEIWLRAKENDPVPAKIQLLWKAAEPSLIKLFPGLKEAEEKARQLVKPRVVDEWLVLQIGENPAADRTEGE